jgi:hypothetical protein
MRTLIALVLTGLVAGCATAPDRAVQMQREVDEMIQVYGPACEKARLQERLGAMARLRSPPEHQG